MCHKDTNVTIEAESEAALDQPLSSTRESRAAVNQTDSQQSHRMKKGNLVTEKRQSHKSLRNKATPKSERHFHSSKRVRYKAIRENATRQIKRQPSPAARDNITAEGNI